MVVAGFIVPDPEFRHLNGFFCNLCCVAIAARKIEVDVPVECRVCLAHDNALDAVGDFRALVLHIRHALYNLFPLRVAVETVVEFRLRDVVSLNYCFLSVSVCGVFSQYTDAGRFHEIRMNTVSINQFNKGAVVAQRP